MGLLENALGVADRAGERASRVPEELRFEQGLGERAAVDRHERARRPPAVRMDRSRDELLAGAALADDQDRGGGVCRMRDLFVDRQHAGGAADQSGRRDVDARGVPASASRRRSARDRRSP